MNKNLIDNANEPEIAVEIANGNNCRSPHANTFSDDDDKHQDEDQNLHVVDVIDDTGDDDARYKILTWNLWCMIFAPRTLSNPQRCGNYLLDMAKQEQWSDFDGLIICSLQELWSWKTGLFPPILLRVVAYCEYIPYLGVLISCLFQLLSLLLGILPILKCLPITYNPKKQMASKLAAFVPYSYYNVSIPWRHILDNGLLMLSNHKADKHGSNGYQNHTCDDSLAYKGFVYAYFKKFHCLAINTHLQAAGDGTARLAQVQELNQFIQCFTRQLKHEMEAMKDCDADYRRNVHRKLKIIACGDWNIDMTNHDEIMQWESQQSMQRELQPNVSASDHAETPKSTDGLFGAADEDSRVEEELRDITTNTKGAPQYETISSMRGDAIYRSTSYANLPGLMGERFVKCSGCHPTCKDEKWGNIDHILCNFEFVSFTEEICGKDGKLSDHLCVKNEFTASQTNLNGAQLLEVVTV